jgi:hypothetical protein
MPAEWSRGFPRKERVDVEALRLLNQVNGSIPSTDFAL